MLSVRIHSSQYPSDIYVKEIENKTANILDIHGHTWKGVSQNKVKKNLLRFPGTTSISAIKHLVSFLDSKDKF